MGTDAGGATWPPAALADPRALAGRWSFDRVVDDRRAGARWTAHGTLDLTVDGPGAVTWSEAGTLAAPGRDPVDVRRRLRLVRRAGEWWVLFEDGRDFHPWRPGDAVVHPCGSDTYEGSVDTDTDSDAEVGPSPATPPGTPAWRVVWTVRGPQKDYTSTTRLFGWVGLSAESRRVEP